jgi:hypothetical protein
VLCRATAQPREACNCRVRPAGYQEEKQAAMEALARLVFDIVK